MDSWRQYIGLIISCCLICGIVTQLVSGTKGKELMNLISGTILAISILNPLTDIHLDPFILPSLSEQNPDAYIVEGKKSAYEAQVACIKTSFEEYILDKAKMLGADIAVEISLDKNRIPVFASIHGMKGSDIQRELERILTMDLGIPKENQKWTWNRENSSSSLP